MLNLTIRDLQLNIQEYSWSVYKTLLFCLSNVCCFVARGQRKLPCSMNESGLELNDSNYTKVDFITADMFTVNEVLHIFPFLLVKQRKEWNTKTIPMPLQTALCTAQQHLISCLYSDYSLQHWESLLILFVNTTLFSFCLHHYCRLDDACLAACPRSTPGTVMTSFCCWRTNWTAPAYHKSCIINASLNCAPLFTERFFCPRSVKVNCRGKGWNVFFF